MTVHCPVCRDGLLEPFSGDYGTGVFHPDGTQEKVYEEGWSCDRCGKRFSDEDLDEVYGGVDLSAEDATLLRVLHSR